MQVNKKKQEIVNREFFIESCHIIRDKILEKICSLNFETNVKSRVDKLSIIFNDKDILLEIKLTDDSLIYRLNVIHSRPKIDKVFTYCNLSDIRYKEDFGKYLYQLKEDMSKLIDNVVFFDSDNKNEFIIDNEFKYSKDFKIPERKKYFY